jgi:hypothetical protein
MLTYAALVGGARLEDMPAERCEDLSKTVTAFTTLCIPTTNRSSSPMLTYAHLCSPMLTYADVC